MKKFLTVAMVVAIAFVFSSCGGKMGGMVKGDEFTFEGWVTEDTFQVVAQGVPKAGLTNTIQKRGTAKEAAQIMAEKRIVEKFVGIKLEGAAGAADYASTGVAVAKEFSGVVKGGEIVKARFDKDDNCEVVYRISSPGLKKRVQGGATPK